MIKSFYTLFDTPSESEQRFCQQLGHIGLLMAGARTHRAAPVGYLTRIVAPAIHHKQVEVFFNGDGAAVGYAIWARIADDVQRRVMTKGSFELHESEWNEGENLWIVDFMAPGGHLKYVLRDLRDNAFKSDQAVRYFKIKGNRRMIKEIPRNTQFNFFKQGTS